MKHTKLRFGRGFRVVLSNRRAQVAEMVLVPGDSEGDPANRHKRADQWLYVVGGSGTAIINRRRIVLRTGVMVLIAHNDRHEIRNTGRRLLRTLNYYCPPGYARSGIALPGGRRS